VYKVQDSDTIESVPDCVDKAPKTMLKEFLFSPSP